MSLEIRMSSGTRPTPVPSRGLPRLSPGRRLAARAVLSALFLLIPVSSHGALDVELAFTLSSFSFLFWGALVMWMCAGFAMVEVGAISVRNASAICLKNVGSYSTASLAYFIVGFGIMYVAVEPGGWLGTVAVHPTLGDAETALLAGNHSGLARVAATGHASASERFFQVVFVASACGIISGTLAERVKLLPFFIFVAVFATVIYPVAGCWTWGGGWLANLGFKDFAGSTVVHSAGGWAALAGAIIVGARAGKFREDGTIKPTPPNSIPTVALGVFIIWFGFIGFNAGSWLSLGSAGDVVGISTVIVNTNLAAAAAVITATFVSRWVFRRTDLLDSLNGAIAGLVAIAAGPEIHSHGMAVFIGATGAIFCLVAKKTLESLKIDDEVGAVSAHMGAGIWGTLAASIAAGGSLLVQVLGVVAVGAFVFPVSILVWKLLDSVLGVRISPDVERIGQDKAELGIEPFPEFVMAEDGGSRLPRLRKKRSRLNSPESRARNALRPRRSLNRARFLHGKAIPETCREDGEVRYRVHPPDGSGHLERHRTGQGGSRPEVRPRSGRLAGAIRADAGRNRCVCG